MSKLAGNSNKKYSLAAISSKCFGKSMEICVDPDHNAASIGINVAIKARNTFFDMV